MPKKYLTVNEVAKIFGITPLTVRNWDKKGALVAQRHPINNYRIYKVEDVESLMKNMESGQKQPRHIVNKQPPPDQPRKLKIEVF